MTDDLLQDILQRLARVEEAVQNHLPTQLRLIEKRMDSTETKLWALLVLALGAVLGAWLR